MAWERGSVRTVRHLSRGRVRYATPMIVVEDTPDRLALFLPAGTRTRWTWVDWDAGTERGPVEHVWAGTDVLELIPTGRAHSIWAMWQAGGGPFLCWYVNLQAPMRRLDDGIVTWDQALDIVVRPDGEWHWKDEDHLLRMQEFGWMTASEAAEVRAEGERVIDELAQRATPFNEPWPEWRPDPHWPTPELPDDWDRVPPESS